MPRHRFTLAEAQRGGRKGGKRSGEVRRRVAHSDEYKSGYKAGWWACERFWRRATTAEIKES